MITATELSRSYDGRPVVQDVSFHCEPGTVTGFLGPNGAGKSTTLRMLTGLTRPDHGTSTIDGRPYAELGNPLRIVGTLLDASAMHAGRSGRNTMRLAARMAGVDDARVDGLLRDVGLERAATKRVGTYSLGMRQRLGIAAALVGDPHVLILDEPANGLDPEGIAWMRRLLRGFADRGGTVLLSSHLLHEVQATVDHLVMIAGGRTVASGPLDELLAGGGTLVRATEPDRLLAALTAAGVPFTPRADRSVVVDTASGRVDAAGIARVALDRHVLITELRPMETRGLEELFFSLTGSDSPRQEAAA